MYLFLKNFKIFILFFFIGFSINLIFNKLNIIENKKNEIIEFLEEKNLKRKKEMFCREDNDYLKFLKMGFEETAEKRFISCMRQSMVKD